MLIFPSCSLPASLWHSGQLLSPAVTPAFTGLCLYQFFHMPLLPWKCSGFHPLQRRGASASSLTALQKTFQEAS